MRAQVGDAAPEAASTGRREIRTASTLSAERVRVADDFAAALDKHGIANTSLAEGYYDTTESVVRRLRSAEKPLSLAHLALSPEEVFVSVLTRAVVRAFGSAGALRCFAACMTAAATKEERR